MRFLAWVLEFRHDLTVDNSKDIVYLVQPKSTARPVATPATAAVLKQQSERSFDWLHNTQWKDLKLQRDKKKWCLTSCDDVELIWADSQTGNRPYEPKGTGKGKQTAPKADHWASYDPKAPWPQAGPIGANPKTAEIAKTPAAQVGADPWLQNDPWKPAQVQKQTQVPTPAVAPQRTAAGPKAAAAQVTRQTSAPVAEGPKQPTTPPPKASAAQDEPGPWDSSDPWMQVSTKKNAGKKQTQAAAAPSPSSNKAPAAAAPSTPAQQASTTRSSTNKAASQSTTTPVEAHAISAAACCAQARNRRSGMAALLQRQGRCWRRVRGVPRGFGSALQVRWATMAEKAPKDSRFIDWTWTALPWRHGEGGGLGTEADKFGLILLSTPMSRELLDATWSMTGRHIVADGGAKVLQATAPELLPDLIVGDFDSAPEAVLQAYREKGVEVRDLSHDQDSTDLEKCLQAAKEAGCECVGVVGQFAGVEGRLDHTFAAMNAMHKAAHVQDICVAMVSDDCICALLREGRHRLGGFAAPPSSCGLVPLGGPVRASTKGLHWDVEDADLEWGGLISTSNCLDSKGDGFVWVDTTGPLLWMCSRARPKVE
eukprot:s454_g2.t2